MGAWWWASKSSATHFRRTLDLDTARLPGLGAKPTRQPIKRKWDAAIDPVLTPASFPATHVYDTVAEDVYERPCGLRGGRGKSYRLELQRMLGALQ